MNIKLSALIVDYEKHIRSGILNSVPWERFGIDIVEEAENGKQAITLFEARGHNIVLLDINMPVAGGLDVALHIRRDQCHVEILFLTGCDVFRRAVTLQASDYLLKPVSFDELLQAIEKAALKAASRHEEAGLVDELKKRMGSGAARLSAETVFVCGDGCHCRRCWHTRGGRGSSCLSSKGTCFSSSPIDST